MYCSQWERTSFSAVAAPAIDLNAQTMDCSIWLAFIRLVTKPRLSEQSAVCTRTQTCILSNRRNTFFDHHFRLAPLCGHDEYHQTISSRSGLYIPQALMYHVRDRNARYLLRLSYPPGVYQALFYEGLGTRLLNYQRGRITCVLLRNNTMASHM